MQTRDVLARLSRSCRTDLALDDPTVARHGSVERDRDGVRPFDLKAVDRLEMDVWLSAIAGVATTRDHLASGDALPRPDREAALLKVTEGDHRRLGLNEHVIPGEPGPSSSQATPLGQCIRDRR